MTSNLLPLGAKSAVKSSIAISPGPRRGFNNTTKHILAKYYAVLTSYNTVASVILLAIRATATKKSDKFQLSMPWDKC